MECINIVCRYINTIGPFLFASFDSISRSDIAKRIIILDNVDISDKKSLYFSFKLKFTHKKQLYQLSMSFMLHRICHNHRRKTSCRRVWKGFIQYSYIIETIFMLFSNIFSLCIALNKGCYNKGSRVIAFTYFSYLT